MSCESSFGLLASVSGSSVSMWNRSGRRKIERRKGTSDVVKEDTFDGSNVMKDEGRRGSSSGRHSELRCIYWFILCEKIAHRNWENSLHL
jgi:hypothetical protein